MKPTPILRLRLVRAMAMTLRPQSTTVPMKPTCPIRCPPRLACGRQANPHLTWEDLRRLVCPSRPNHPLLTYRLPVPTSIHRRETCQSTATLLSWLSARMLYLSSQVYSWALYCASRNPSRKKYVYASAHLAGHHALSMQLSYHARLVTSGVKFLQ